MFIYPQKANPPEHPGPAALKDGSIMVILPEYPEQAGSVIELAPHDRGIREQLSAS